MSGAYSMITFALYALKFRASLIISILVTSIVAIVVGVQKVDTTNLVTTPNFSTLGLGLQDPFQAFAKLGFISAILTIFAIMLSDFFDTMGTVTGIAAEAGLARADGSVPGVGRVLMVDSVAAIAGGVGGVSSNTTYIESAAGVADGGRTGFASVVTAIPTATRTSIVVDGEPAYRFDHVEQAIVGPIDAIAVVSHAGNGYIFVEHSVLDGPPSGEFDAVLAGITFL